MFSDVSLHVVYKIANAPIQPFPFPHIVVRDVFPRDFYRELRANLPPPELFRTLTALKRVGGDYPDSRLVLPLASDALDAVPSPAREFWREIAGWMLGGAFGTTVLSKFDWLMKERFGEVERRQFHDEALLVQDYTTYALGPHTDRPTKVKSFLFYLPPDDSRPHLGTSLYAPRDPRFTCTGGPHHPFELFHRVYTMPYLPNTLFAFPKTANSFHGVEPIQDTEVRRDLLLYDIMVQNPPELERPAAQAPAAAGPGRFSF
jgi:hypothetical protein